MSWAAFSVVAARTILQMRETRRKLIAYTIVALLVIFALGNWPLREWLGQAPLRFLAWWGGCAMLAVFLFLLGLYDFLQVIRENRED